MPWFVNDDGNLDGLFYLLMIATQICQQVFSSIDYLSAVKYRIR